MPLVRTAFPLRYGRPYGAGAASFTFVVAGAEFSGLVYGAIVVFGRQPFSLPFVDTVLPAAYVVAAAAAGVMFLLTRARSAELRSRVTMSARDLEAARLAVLRELAAKRGR